MNATSMSYPFYQEEEFKKLDDLMQKGNMAEAVESWSTLFVTKANEKFSYRSKKRPDPFHLYESVMSIGEQLNKKEEMEDDLREKMFYLLFRFLKARRGDDVYPYDLYQLCFNLALTLKKAKEFVPYLDKKLAKRGLVYIKNKGEKARWMDHESTCFYAMDKFKLLYLSGQREDAYKVLNEYGKADDMQRVVASFLVEQCEQSEAAKIIFPRINDKTKHTTFLEDSIWEIMLIRMLMNDSDKGLLKHYLRQFLLNVSFSFDLYLEQLYELLNKREWDAFAPELIARLKEYYQEESIKYQEKGYRFFFPRKLAYLYAIQGQQEELLHLVRQAPRIEDIEDYHEYLVPEYSKELLSIYEPFIKQQAEAVKEDWHGKQLISKISEIIADIPDAKVPFEKIILGIKKKMEATLQGGEM